MSLAGYAPSKPHFEILEVLASIAAYQDSKYVPGKGKRWGRAGAWCIVRQAVIRGWYERLFKRYERTAATMTRRTLQYHLAALRRSGHLRSAQRHTNGRGTRKLELRPSIYEFTLRGKQWISRRAGWVENPAAMLAAQKIAQSGFNPDPYSSTSLSRAVGKTSTAPGPSGPTRKAALRSRTSSSTHRAASAPRKAPVRGGGRQHRADPSGAGIGKQPRSERAGATQRPSDPRRAGSSSKRRA